jgi:hypothetical protein
MPVLNPPLSDSVIQGRKDPSWGMESAEWPLNPHFLAESSFR